MPAQPPQALKLAGLDRFVASSYESQRKVNVAVQGQIIRQCEAGRAPGDFTIANDETFTGGLTLVAIGPENDFILLEKPSKTRDALAGKQP